MMRKTHVGLGVALLVGMMAVAACGAPAPAPMPMQGTADDEAAIRGLLDGYLTAFNAADAAGMVAFVSDNYEAVQPNGTHISGRAAYQQMVEAETAGRQAAGVTINVSGTTDYLKWVSATHAVVGGKFTVTGVPAGAPSSGSWMGVVAKSATGEWQYLSALVADYMPPPQAPAAPAAAGS